MRILQNISLTFFLLAFSTNSKAFVYVEPFVGVNILGNEEMTSNNMLVSYDRTGYFYGAKLGIPVMPGLVFGGEFRNGETAGELTQPVTGFTDATFDTSSIGIYLSYNAIPLLNFWGTYYLVNDQEISISNNTTIVTGSTYSGSRYALGVGYTGFPFISINFEYSFFEFDEVEVDGTVHQLPNTAFDITTNKGSEFLVSISVPLNLPF